MDKLLKMLEEMDIPFAYDHFAEGESPDPPFICYLIPGTDHFSADGRVYKKINEIHIELYTDFKDLSVEQKVEAVLDEHGIFMITQRRGSKVKRCMKSYIHLKWRLKLWQIKSNII